MNIEQRIEALGLYLPEPTKVPAGIQIDFAWARLYGDRVYVSGHAPTQPDGSFRPPAGRVGEDVTPEQAAEAARFATLSMLGSIRRVIGDLDRIAAWLRVDGFVLVAPGFAQTTNVVNGCSHLLAKLFGPEIAVHARTAIGVAATPLSSPVILAAELALKPA